MKKHPIRLAALIFGGIFIFFILVIIGSGTLRRGTVAVPGAERVGVLEVQGAITETGWLLEQIEQFTSQKSVKAVVLRIESPGGGVVPSQELHAALKHLAETKPLIVSMGSVAASGGYYLAVAGERIFANPGTITGSIGVIMSFPDYQELMNKVGVRQEVVKSGRFKDIGSATRDLSEADRALLQEMISDVHAQFVAAVSEGRSMSVEELQPLVDGRIFTGRQALENGLVDELGTFKDAIAYAGNMVGLGNDPHLIYPEEEPHSLFDRYLESMAGQFGLKLPVGYATGPQYLWAH